MKFMVSNSNIYNSQIKIFVQVEPTNSKERVIFKNADALPGQKSLFRTTRTKNNTGQIMEGPLYQKEFNELAGLIAAHRKS